jgi:hypothetical protein
MNKKVLLAQTPNLLIVMDILPEDQRDIANNKRRALSEKKPLAEEESLLVLRSLLCEIRSLGYFAAEIGTVYCNTPLICFKIYCMVRR